MKIGIIGAGRMAQTVGLLSTRAGHQVMLRNSRGPKTVRRVGQQIGCEVGTVDDAAAFGEMTVAATRDSFVHDDNWRFDHGIRA